MTFTVLKSVRAIGLQYSNRGMIVLAVDVVVISAVFTNAWNCELWYPRRIHPFRIGPANVSIAIVQQQH